MNSVTHRFHFRGFSHIRGRSYQAHTTWFGSRCTITADAITVGVMRREHVHPREGLIELRWISLPFPGFIAISREAALPIWSGFSVLHTPRLKEALVTCGYVFTRESRWPSLSRQDVRTYGLYEYTNL